MIFCQVSALFLASQSLSSAFQTRKSAEWLAGEMCRQGHSVALITGDSTTDQRVAVLNRCASYFVAYMYKDQ